MYRAKTNSVIADYDRRVLNNLKTVHATKVLQLKNYAVYRIDRATTMAVLADAVPTVSHIDFASVNATRHSWPAGAYRGSSKTGRSRTHLGNGAVPDEALPDDPDQARRPDAGGGNALMGQLMLRSEAVCDLRLTFAFAKRAMCGSRSTGSRGPLFGNTATLTVPVRYLTKASTSWSSRTCCRAS